MIPAHVFAPATMVRPAIETRLLVVRVATGDMREHAFADFASLLSPRDVVVVNDAATVPASLFGETSRGEPIELRLLALPDESRECDAVIFGAGDWRTPTEHRAPPPRVAKNDAILVAGLEATIVSTDASRHVRVRFERDRDEAISTVYRAGKPVQYTHIRAPLALWDVQNLYAAEPWAAEMPSAGRALDFAALDALRKRGVIVARVTHGAGLSSIGSSTLDASLPWVERYRIPMETSSIIDQARREGHRVVAVGTSVVRALESWAFDVREATTDLRIDAHHRLRVVTGLLTGMHDPTTSHADLLKAFAPAELLASASEFASSRGFLGHEFGDSCLILAA